MADFIDVVTKDLYLSANTVDYLSGPYLVLNSTTCPCGIEELLSVPKKYRKIENDIVSVMTQAERDIYDAANPEQQYIDRVDILSNIFDNINEVSYPGMTNRLINAFNKYPVILAFLDAYNYTYARLMVDTAYVAEDITENDRDYVKSYIPEII